MSNLQTVNQAELIMTVMSGPDKGAVYKIVSAKVRIGRSADNDIVIKDPRCSRHHAEIHLTPQGIFIKDVSTSSGMDVDGTPTKESILKTGTHITLGATILKFEVRSAGQAALPQSQSTALANPTPSAPMGFEPQFGTKKKSQMPMIVAVLGILFLFIIMGNNARKKEDVEIRTDEQIEEDIKAAQERRKALEMSQEKRGVNTQEYKEVQGYYTQGFRDYREGNYSRALQAFDNALALRPDYELARKYRDLAKRRQDELIQLTMLEGKRYMEQGKYQAAKNSYSQAMILIADPKNKQFIEAQEYYNECDLLLKGAY